VGQVTESQQNFVQGPLVWCPMTKLKVVVRRLPPNLPEPIFWNSVAQWVSSESITWKSFHPGKPRSRFDLPNPLLSGIDI
jgi:hypothetical protein